MFKKSLLLATAAVLALAGLIPSPASAGSITFNLDYEFSGATPPASSTTPWVTATFTDITGGVELEIEASNLTGVEYISAFYFNLSPSLSAASYLPSVGAGTQTAYNTIAAGNNAFQADGDGQFDFAVDFPPPPGAFGDKFTAGENFILTFTGLTVSNFEYTSVNGPVGKTGFYAAAHVQGIGTNGEGSGWIGARSVPDGGSLAMLLGAALMGLAGVRRMMK